MTKANQQQVHIFNVPEMRKKFEQDRKKKIFTSEYAISPEASRFYEFKKFDRIVKKAAKLSIEMPFECIPDYPEPSVANKSVFDADNIRVGYTFPTQQNTSGDVFTLTKALVDGIEFQPVGDKAIHPKKIMHLITPLKSVRIYNQDIINEIMADGTAYYFFAYGMPRICTQEEAEMMMDHYSKVLDFYEKGEQFLEICTLVEELEAAKKAAKLAKAETK